MSDHISPSAQHAAVPAEDTPEPQHGAHQHTHDHQYQANHGGSIKGNSEKAMAAFHDQMMALAKENTPESRVKSNEIAHMLLERAELPLAIRARAHIVLSSGKTNYLFHAQEAVRIAEKGRDIFGSGETAQEKHAVETLLWEAREMLRRAERDMKELEDIRARKRAGTLKVKKGEKLFYGNQNDDFDEVAPKPVIENAGDKTGDEEEQEE